MIFLATLKQMIILFIFVTIGYIFNRKKYFPAKTDEVIAKLENNLLMPALIINTFYMQCTIENLSKKYSIFVAGIIVLTITVGIAYGLAKIFGNDDYTRKIYRYSFAFPNIGFMGIAVVQGIGGEELLFDYMIFTLPYNLLIYSIGITWLLPSVEQGSFNLGNLKNPLFGAMAIGIALGLVAIPIPTTVQTALSALSSAMSPLAMLLTGYVIAKFDVKELLKIQKVYGAVLFRLIIIPVLIYAVFYLFRIPNNIMIPTICALAMPMGLNTVVIPTAYGLNVDLGASMALVSSVAAIATIPLIFALIL